MEWVTEKERKAIGTDRRKRRKRKEKSYEARRNGTGGMITRCVAVSHCVLLGSRPSGNVSQWCSQVAKWSLFGFAWLSVWDRQIGEETLRSFALHGGNCQTVGYWHQGFTLTFSDSVEMNDRRVALGEINQVLAPADLTAQSTLELISPGG